MKTRRQPPKSPGIMIVGRGPNFDKIAVQLTDKESRLVLERLTKQIPKKERRRTEASNG